jgi:Holliday junction resolvasome RuvABC ATP-dependent DNA helicase subunit
MYFQGQPALMRQLGLFLPNLLEHTTEALNILLNGPSGWGKTRLALLSCNYLCPNGDFEISVPRDGRISFNEDFRVHFIDEVHKLQDPETLYHTLDSNRFVVFMATNELDGLLEPLINRCVPLTFEPYSMGDLIEITKSYMDVSIDLPEEFYPEIVNAGLENPRVIASLAKRLSLYIKRNGVPDSITRVLKEFFGIQDGIDANGTRYLDALSALGGRASLDTLAGYLHMNKGLLLYQVEPVLLHKRLIQIGRAGRSLV